MNKTIKNLLVGAAAVFSLSQIAACSFSDTDASNMTCVYNGGPLDDQSYAGYVAPGKGHEYQGMFSETIDVPVTVRQYRVALDPTRGDTPTADSVNVKVRGIDLKFEPTVNFTLSTILNGDKPAACDFIEKHLRAIGATDFTNPTGGWVNNFLNERFRPILDDVASRVLQKYDPTDLVGNIDGERDKAALEIAEALDPRLQQAFGGNYFCAPNYQFAEPEEKCGVASVVLPVPVFANSADADLIAAPQRAKTVADNAIAVAKEEARKAEQIASQKQVEADSAEALADAQEEIAQQQRRVEQAQAAIDYAWCRELIDLGQRCDLVKAAENGDYPDIVLGQSDTPIAVAVNASESSTLGTTSPTTTTPDTVPVTSAP